MSFAFRAARLVGRLVRLKNLCRLESAVLRRQQPKGYQENGDKQIGRAHV